MSYSVLFDNTIDEKHYNRENDRLFLIYYALPPGFNANNWGVSDRSLGTNIKTAIDKPVIIRRKESSNPFHSNQAGNYVHPLPEESGLKRVEDYLNWQEQWAVGRVRNIDKRGKGYAWTLEITDPEVKNILKSNDYKTGIPGYTSPQILTFPKQYPEEEQIQLYDHWLVSHVILTDSPAYGFEKSAMAGKCLGPEEECMIKTKSASKENIGFCIKQATIDLINSRQEYSSQSSGESTNLYHNMSSQDITQPSNSNEVVVNKTLSEQNAKQEGEQQAQPAGSGIGVEGDANEREQTPREEEPQLQANTLEEANALIKKLSDQNRTKDEMLRSTQKEMKSILKWKDQIENERRIYRLKSTIPRDLFKSEESHNKEVERIIEKGLDSDLEFLKGHYDLMRQARIAQSNIDVAPVPKAKSASVHEVPNYDSESISSKNTQSSSLVQKQLELQRMIIEGGI